MNFVKYPHIYIYIYIYAKRQIERDICLSYCYKPSPAIPAHFRENFTFTIAIDALRAPIKPL